MPKQGDNKNKPGKGMKPGKGGNDKPNDGGKGKPNKGKKVGHGDLDKKITKAVVDDGTHNFGRLVEIKGNVKSMVVTDQQAGQMAGLMVDDPPDTAAGESSIPSGYTFFGQFVDHDLTLDDGSILGSPVDPSTIEDIRTPFFDLDCVYGLGKTGSPGIYDGDRLRIDQHDAADDLPRDSAGLALIGDPRNDENTAVSQLQLAFLNLHNAVLDGIATTPSLKKGGESDFAAAQRLTRWLYQWAVVHDFLPRVVGQALVDDIFQPHGNRPVRTKIFDWKKRIFMPVEFSVAAYRFGHSMVRATYPLNASRPDVAFFGSGVDMQGFRPLPAGHTIDWDHYFQIDGSSPVMARTIDTHLVPPLHDMPSSVVGTGLKNLAHRNIMRGHTLGLPSGQAVAKKLGAAPMSDSQLGHPGGGDAPLFWYVLKEAEITQGGQRLGEVGGRIVAEVCAGLLAGDPTSYLNASPAWTPGAPFTTTGNVTVPDLLKFAGVA
ncbi:peroxidase family protein [Salsipaludibacter albus]|uniref:peroxidase family protein n=1 Tax=Salsipaludibacter albus TaxID=2849650 RepID=UPI001EE47A00|nr:heme peroxidase family protein [Salsipaludibacter albus]MBY5162284.1 peroxidase [Salsipaludibacter albus]